MRQAFSAYIEEHPWIKGIFVGTRRTDPHGEKMRAFEETDGNWARFTRINPVLEWEYDEVWKFLNWGKWKICELYEQGYTSLGGVGDTVENPALKVTEEDGRIWYKPAWNLEDGSLERAGRGRSK
jgi:FAD synthetase